MKGQQPFVKQWWMDRVIKEVDIAIDMRIRGVRIDQNKLAEHYANTFPLVNELEQKFQQTYGVEPRSPKQLSNLLFKEFKLPDLSGKHSTEDRFLTKVYEGIIGDLPEKQLLDDLFSFRENDKIKSVYCEGLFKRIHSDGRVHPEWDPTATNTGRWGCKDPNMMNFPAHFRDVVVSDEDKVLIGADYSKMQVWAAAILSKDEEMIEVLSDPKRNIHKEVLNSIEEVYPLTKLVGPEQALLRAKAVVFGTLFDRTPQDIAREFRVDDRVAKLWQEQYLNKFKKMKLYLEGVAEFWKKNGYVEGIYGRRKFAKKQTDAKNHPIQNFEAEVVINALFKLKEKGFHPIISVHDQLICEESNQNIKERFEEFKEILETSSTDIWPRFKVEGNIGTNWKEVK
jgi:DNA polymerase-1